MEDKISTIKKEKLFSINVLSEKREDVILQLAEAMNPYINKDTTIFCIGTDKMIMDAVGPLTGSKLKILNLKNKVIGTIEQPAHALNLHKRIEKINKKSKVLAIDACLGDRFADIKFYKGCIKPGKGAGKDLPAVGDFSICITTNDDYSEIFNNNIRLKDINNFSDIISKAIYICINGEQSLNKKLKKIDSIISNINKEE